MMHRRVAPIVMGKPVTIGRLHADRAGWSGTPNSPGYDGRRIRDENDQLRRRC